MKPSVPRPTAASLPIEEQTPEAITQPFWRWGWNRNAEIWNGRLAMLLFILLIPLLIYLF